VITFGEVLVEVGHQEYWARASNTKGSIEAANIDSRNGSGSTSQVAR
jgi:hypothetical protein